MSGSGLAEEYELPFAKLCQLEPVGHHLANATRWLVTKGVTEQWVLLLRALATVHRVGCCHRHFLVPPRALAAGRECAAAFKALLELVHQIVLKPTHDKKQKLPAFSKEVATCVGEVVQAAEVLKGQPTHTDSNQGPSQ